MPSNDINDALTGANVLGDVAVRFSKESGGLMKNKGVSHRK